MVWQEGISPLPSLTHEAGNWRDAQQASDRQGRYPATVPVYQAAATCTRQQGVQAAAKCTRQQLIVPGTTVVPGSPNSSDHKGSRK